MLRATESLPLPLTNEWYFPSCYLCYRKVLEVKASQVMSFPKKKIA